MYLPKAIYGLKHLKCHTIQVTMKCVLTQGYKWSEKLHQSKPKQHECHTSDDEMGQFHLLSESNDTQQSCQGDSKETEIGNTLKVKPSVVK